MRRKKLHQPSISLETMYIFKKTYFDDELKAKAMKFLADFKVLHAVDFAEHLPKLDKCAKRLEDRKYNNIYDFLENLLKNVFKTKNEREMFFALVEKYFGADNCEKLIDINDQTEEFDM